MGKFTSYGSDELVTELNRLADRDEVRRIGYEMIESGLEIIADEITQYIKRNHVHTGNLAKSIIKTKPKTDENGGVIYGRVTYSGYDKDTGVPNALKANVLEYGSSTQPPRPYHTEIVNSVADEVEAAMRETFENEVEEL